MKVALLVTALALACSTKPDRTLALLSVEPVQGDANHPTEIVIRGERFSVAATTSAGDAAGDTLDASYQAWLGNVELTAVRWVDAGTLAATVPAGAARGLYDLAIEAPGGHRASLGGAYRVVGGGDPDDDGGSAGGGDAVVGDGTGSVEAPTGGPGTGLDPAAEAVLIAEDPFGDGTSSAQLVVYGGRLLLAPDRTGTTLLAIDPAGAAVTRVPLVIPGDASRTGRGLWASGTLGGRGWLLGADAVGPPTEVPLTRASGAPLVFEQAKLPGDAARHADLITAALFDGDRLYLGLGGVEPGLVALRAPDDNDNDDDDDDDDDDEEDGDGGDTDLRLDEIAGVGDDHTLVDALVRYRGHLHVATTRGLVRSTEAHPDAPDDLVVITPSAAAWRAASSRATAKRADLLPADRAIPGMVVWQGRLLVARNADAAGAPTPQIWACTPNATGASSACDRGDWALAAGDADGVASRMNDPGNGSITLLAATGAWLYVGYDSPDGLRLFRARSALSSAADFRGAGGCVAGEPTACRGVGGDGLGDVRNTRILDARVVSLSGTPTLFVVAGDGVGPLRVYRIAE